MNNTEKTLSEKLLEKSQEAFIVAVEHYNKPTVKYRVEGFSFFICNAWELLLKSYIIKTQGLETIYYKDNPTRTLSLENCIKKIFTNDKDPLRKNLERIISLRNTSTHFITEEYEQIYVPLFQSCVLNYVNKLITYFDIDITEKLGSNFLTLSVKVSDLSEDAIRARYPEQIANHIVEITSSIGRAINETNNQNYAITVQHNFYLTRKQKDSSVSFSIAKSAEQATFIIKDRYDMQNVCPFKMTECLKIINDKIQEQNLNFINPAHIGNPQKEHIFNKFVFDLFVKFYDLKTDTKYCYCYSRNSIPMYTYSNAVIELIIEQIKKDPEHIVQSLKSKVGKPTPGAKDSKP